MSAPDHTNNGPRANDAVANRDGRQDGAGASPRGPAAPADPRDDETANEFGSYSQGGFTYGGGNDGNRIPVGIREYKPAPTIIPNKDEKSSTVHRCKPSEDHPEDRDGDS